MLASASRKEDVQSSLPLVYLSNTNLPFDSTNDAVDYRFHTAVR